MGKSWARPNQSIARFELIDAVQSKVGTKIGELVARAGRSRACRIMEAAEALTAGPVAVRMNVLVAYHGRSLLKRSRCVRPQFAAAAQFVKRGRTVR